MVLFLVLLVMLLAVLLVSSVVCGVGNVVTCLYFDGALTTVGVGDVGRALLVFADFYAKVLV